MLFTGGNPVLQIHLPYASRH